MAKTCNICGKSYKNSAGLAKHRSRKHSDEPKPNSQDVDDRGYPEGQVIKDLPKAEIGGKPPSKYEEYKALAGAFGFDVGILVEGITAEVLGRIPIIPEAPSAIDQTEAIIEGVAERLRPQLVEATNRAAETVFEARSKSLLGEMQKRLEERVAEEKVEVTSHSRDGTSITSFIDRLLDRSDKIIELVKAVRPPPTPEAQIAQQFRMGYGIHKMFSKIEKGQADIDNIEETIRGFISPPGK